MIHQQQHDSQPEMHSEDLLHAVHLADGVKVFQMQKVQQHLRHVLILINDLLCDRKQPHDEIECLSLTTNAI